MWRSEASRPFSSLGRFFGSWFHFWTIDVQLYLSLGPSQTCSSVWPPGVEHICGEQLQLNFKNGMCWRSSLEDAFFGTFSASKPYHKFQIVASVLRFKKGLEPSQLCSSAWYPHTLTTPKQMDVSGPKHCKHLQTEREKHNSSWFEDNFFDVFSTCKASDQLSKSKQNKAISCSYVMQKSQTPSIKHLSYKWQSGLGYLYRPPCRPKSNSPITVGKAKGQNGAWQTFCTTAEFFWTCKNVQKLSTSHGKTARKLAPVKQPKPTKKAPSRLTLRLPSWQPARMCRLLTSHTSHKICKPLQLPSSSILCFRSFYDLSLACFPLLLFFPEWQNEIKPAKGLDLRWRGLAL